MREPPVPARALAGLVTAGLLAAALGARGGTAPSSNGAGAARAGFVLPSIKGLNYDGYAA